MLLTPPGQRLPLVTICHHFSYIHGDANTEEGRFRPVTTAALELMIASGDDTSLLPPASSSSMVSTTTPHDIIPLPSAGLHVNDR